MRWLSRRLRCRDLVSCLRKLRGFLSSHSRRSRHHRGIPGRDRLLPGVPVGCSRLSAKCRALAETQLPPPVSILKPLKGKDPEIYESFRSHCLQNYPKYELIFGVSDPHDPAAHAVERLRREFPQHSIQLIVCAERLGTNAKVSNLVQMARAASYDHFIVSDSDIRVSPDYLQRVIAPFANPNVGVVTCLYRGDRQSNTRVQSSNPLESAQIFWREYWWHACLKAQCASHWAPPWRFAATIFERSEVLNRILDYLADDYELGKRIAALGREVVISEEIVDTFLPAYTIRTIHRSSIALGARRACRPPRGYLRPALHIRLAVGLAGGIGIAGSFLVLGTSGLCCIIARSGRVERRLACAARPPGSPLVPHAPTTRSDCSAGLDGKFRGNTVTWRGDRFTVQ